MKMNEEQISKLETLHNKIYKETEEYGRTQFVSRIVDLEHNWNGLKNWLEEEIYKIEPKGTAINYNCEYDSEEDYINAMKERSKLITLKRVLIMLQSLEEGGNNERTA